MAPRGMTRATALVAAGALAAMVLAACGGGGSSSAGGDLPSGLDPQPLDQPTTLTVSAGTKAEAFAPLLLAEALGELKKENITLNWVSLPSTEALPALAQGKTDVAASGLTAGLFNGIADGAGIRLVYPGPSNNTVDGLWVTLDPATGEPQPVTGVGISAGATSTAVVPISRYLESVGQNIVDVPFSKIPIEDLPAALEDGVVNGVWLNAPAQVPIEEKGIAKHVAWYGPGEYGTGYSFGPNLLEKNPAAGQALIRAMVRTAQTYLTGDYKANPETVQALATAIGVEPADITSTPSLSFDPVLSTELFQKAQDIWLTLGDIVSYSEPLQPDQYVDPSFLDRATASS